MTSEPVKLRMKISHCRDQTLGILGQGLMLSSAVCITEIVYPVRLRELLWETLRMLSPTR